jgi:hypothetical protein
LFIIWAKGESSWLSVCDETADVVVLLELLAVVVFVKPEFFKAALRIDWRKLLVIPLMLLIILLSAC